MICGRSPGADSGPQSAAELDIDKRIVSRLAGSGRRAARWLSWLDAWASGRPTTTRPAGPFGSSTLRAQHYPGRPRLSHRSRYGPVRTANREGRGTAEQDLCPGGPTASLLGGGRQRRGPVLDDGRRGPAEFVPGRRARRISRLIGPDGYVRRTATRRSETREARTPSTSVRLGARHARPASPRGKSARGNPQPPAPCRLPIPRRDRHSIRTRLLRGKQLLNHPRCRLEDPDGEHPTVEVINTPSSKGGGRTRGGKIFIGDRLCQKGRRNQSISQKKDR